MMARQYRGVTGSPGLRDAIEKAMSELPHPGWSPDGDTPEAADDEAAERRQIEARLHERMALAEAELQRQMRAVMMRALMYDENDGRHPKWDAALMTGRNPVAEGAKPTPPRTRQFPSHQSYDHLVAMRNLEDD